jgi:hypothetical protein
MYIASGKEYVLKGPADYVVKDTEITGSTAMPPVTRDTAWRASNQVLAQVGQTSAASVRMRSIGKQKVEEPVLIYPTKGAVATLQPTLALARRRQGAGRSDAAGRGPGKAAGEDEGHGRVVQGAREGAGARYRIPVGRLRRRQRARQPRSSAPSRRTRSRRWSGARPSDKADFSDRLLFTLMLQEMGAVQEARESWARLAQERSDLPELAALREVIARLAAALVAAVALAARAADPVAFVADLQGNATIEGNGKVSFLAELAPGTRLLLGTGATVAVTYATTGAEFTLRGPGEFVVSASEVKAERGTAPTRRTVSVLPDPALITQMSRTANASLRMRGITAPATSRMTLEYPVNTRVVTLQPTLRWSGEPTAEEFASSSRIPRARTCGRAR